MRAAMNGASDSGSVSTAPVISRKTRRSIGPTSQSRNIAAIPQRRSYWCSAITITTRTNAAAACGENVSSQATSAAQNPPTTNSHPTSAVRVPR